MSEPTKSRSVLRREAVQKGEPMPTFDAQSRLPLTPAERADLRQRADKAVPGPYSISKPRSKPFGMVEVPVHVGDAAQRGNAFALVSLGGRGAIGMSEGDVVAQASYIAAISPDRLLALLDEVERLHQLCHDLKATYRAMAAKADAVESGAAPDASPYDLSVGRKGLRP